jgi:hypothetical protein
MKFVLSFDTTRTAYKILCCRGNVFTEPLPSNYKGIHIETYGLMGGIYKVRR